MSKGRLKILHVIPNLAKGGAERLCLDICRQFAKMGADVKLVAFDKSVEYEALLNSVDYKVFDLLNSVSIRHPNSPTMQAFKQYVNEFSPDVVHTHLFSAELIWKLTRIEIPTVFHIHDNIKSFSPFATGFPKKENLIKLYEKLSYKKLKKIQKTHFLTISKDTNNYIKRKLKLNNSDVSLLCEDSRELNSLRLVTIGSLVPKKGHSFLLDLVTGLKKITNKSVELIVLGDGPLKQKLLLEKEEKGLSNEVSFLGKVNNPEEYLRQANFYVHGAYEEPFGLVLIEAMASGLPVFTTDGGGNKDLMNNRENGFIYFYRNATKIANDILELSESEKDYNRVRLNAIEFSKKFDIKDYGRNLEVIYRSLLN